MKTERGELTYVCTFQVRRWRLHPMLPIVKEIPQRHRGVLQRPEQVLHFRSHCFGILRFIKFHLDFISYVPSATSFNLHLKTFLSDCSTSFAPGTREIGNIPIRNEYCPITGQYHFTYSLSKAIECNSFSSSFHNCPDGSVLRLHFNRCNFEPHGNFLLFTSLLTHVNEED